MKNPETIGILKNMYEEEIEHVFNFELWIESKLKPMYYSEKQKMNVLRIKNNFTDAKFLNY